jgi:hypothetical protein
MNINVLETDAFGLRCGSPIATQNRQAAKPAPSLIRLLY